MKKVPAVRLVEREAAQALRELPNELRVAMTDKHAKQPGRLVRRHGSAPGSVVPGGQRVPVDQPRARTVQGTGCCSTLTCSPYLVETPCR